MCMMEFSSIVYQVNDRLATIKLNTPNKLNAMDARMAMEITTALLDAEDDPAVKVILITGEGKAFCAGGDVSVFTTLDLQDSVKLIQDAHSVCRAFKDNKKPIIAAVNGFAVGAGLSLVLMSDIIISSDKAMYGAAFINVGLIPDMGSLYFLPRQVGLPKAKEMMLTGKNITAQEALNLGIVNEVVPHEQLQSAVDNWCLTLAGQPALAMENAKTLLNKGMDMGIDELLSMEALAQGICMQSADGKEGIDAFLNKRKPNFK